MESNAMHSLTPAEWRLVNALREVPESALRTRVNALVEGLIELAREPKCAEHMADGVPVRERPRELRPVRPGHAHAGRPRGDAPPDAGIPGA